MLKTWVGEPVFRHHRVELVVVADLKRQQALLAHAAQREAQLRESLGRAGVDTLELSTEDDLADTVLRFIDLRKRRLRVGKHAQAGRSMPTQMPSRDRGSFGIPREGTRP